VTVGGWCYLTQLFANVAINNKDNFMATLYLHYLRDGQTTDLRNQMNQIEGRDCTGYSIKNEDYYEWHAENHCV
jgi:hypothetical protein